MPKGIRYGKMSTKRKSSALSGIFGGSPAASSGYLTVKRARRGAPPGMRSGGYRGSRPSMEMKYIDNQKASYNADTTGTITHINAVPQGASESNRIGRKMNNRSIEVRGTVAANSLTLATTARILFVYDRQPNKALAAIGDILDIADSYGLKKDANKERFLILKDKMFSIAGNTTTAGQITDKSIQHFKWFKKCRLPTVFSNVGSGAIGDVTTGALLMITTGGTAAGTAAATFALSTRVRFDDM